MICIFLWINSLYLLHINSNPIKLGTLELIAALLLLLLVVVIFIIVIWVVMVVVIVLMKISFRLLRLTQNRTILMDSCNNPRKADTKVEGTRCKHSIYLNANEPTLNTITSSDQPHPIITVTSQWKSPTGHLMLVWENLPWARI